MAKVWNGWYKSFDCGRIFSKVAKHGFQEFSWGKGIFLQEAIVLACFQSEKKTQNKLDLMQSFLLRRFTKPVEIHLRGSKAKKSHLSNFPFSFYLNLYQDTNLSLVKTWRIKTFNKNIKYYQESMQFWTNYQHRFKTGSWCIPEYNLPKSDDYLLHYKIIQI